MVAVPRSKGCVTCRHRRVKCDEAKPVCQRCTGAGYQCGGYNRDAIFRNLSSAPLPPSSPPRRPKQIVELSVPPSLDLRAFKDNICGAYLFQNFVWRTYGTPWLELAAQGRLDPLSLETTRALAFSYFGKDHHQERLQVEGANCYGRALQQLMAGLSSPDQTSPADFVVPILVLILYASARGDQAGAVSHVRGLMMLLRSCGPKQFQDPILRSALESSRATLVTIALITKTRTFLEQPQWRNDPWTGNESAKGNQSQLMDILVLVPAILADLKQLGRGHPSVTPSHVLDRACEQLQALFRWRWQWEREHGAKVWSQPRRDATPGPRVFEHELQFASLALVSDIMLYNAVLLWILGIISKMAPAATTELVHEAAQRARDAVDGEVRDRASEASSSLSSSSPSPPPLQRPGEATTLRAAAVEICQTLAYHMQHIQQSQDSSLFYLFPIGMAWNILRDDPAADFQRWIEATLTASPITKDYFTDGYQWLWKLQTNSFRSLR